VLSESEQEDLHLIDASELKRVIEKARTEGYAVGYAEGFASGKVFAEAFLPFCRPNRAL
jgi:hypothetical protein